MTLRARIGNLLWSFLAHSPVALQNARYFDKRLQGLHNGQIQHDNRIEAVEGVHDELEHRLNEHCDENRERIFLLENELRGLLANTNVRISQIDARLSEFIVIDVAAFNARFSNLENADQANIKIHYIFAKQISELERVFQEVQNSIEQKQLPLRKADKKAKRGRDVRA